MPHTTCKILNSEGGICNIDEEGELFTKGYNVMSGYYNNEKETQLAIKEGWMRTGDLCMVDKYGYLKVTGRQKDVIIRGGENISPKEIEDELLGLGIFENV